MEDGRVNGERKQGRRLHQPTFGPSFSSLLAVDRRGAVETSAKNTIIIKIILIINQD